jgi:hypothetical protein
VTEEEAVEVILEGNPWDMCVRCTGGAFIYEMDENNLMTADPDVCPDCKGTGCEMRPRYRLACKTLGRRPPKAKLGQWNEMQSRVFETKADLKHFQRTIAAGLGVPMHYLGLKDDDEEPESSPFR